MDLFYQFMELFATFAEGIMALSVSARMSGSRFSRKKNCLLIFGFTVFYTVFVTLMNEWKVFSFVTIIVCILYTLLITKIISKGSFLLRATSTMISWFSLHAIDYLIFYCFLMIAGHSLDISKCVETVMSSGNMRAVFLAIDKITEIIIFITCRRIYDKLRLLDNKYLGVILTITSGSYIIMSIITAFIMSSTIWIIQITVIFALVFIVVSFITTVFAIGVSSKYQAEKRESEMMALTNAMMEKNFKQTQAAQNTVRQQVHDFKNHIRTINGMLKADSPAKKYVEDLLAVSSEQAQYCHCSNEVINSIVNCKINDAELYGIPFEHYIMLSSPVHISSVDICAILANQIDNALEACKKMPPESNRFIKVKIWQKEAFIFFKVINSAAKNPFGENGELKSTKDSKTDKHGFGVKNILRTVNSYGGTLKNEYNNGCFTSTAMLPNNEH
ncbi:MAG: sensor histidine kinase [Acutalibacteraceae bacterium]